jgi:hypothetical protein
MSSKQARNQLEIVDYPIGPNDYAEFTRGYLTLLGARQPKNYLRLIGTFNSSSIVYSFLFCSCAVTYTIPTTLGIGCDASHVCANDPGWVREVIRRFTTRSDGRASCYASHVLMMRPTFLDGVGERRRNLHSPILTSVKRGRANVAGTSKSSQKRRSQLI